MYILKINMNVDRSIPKEKAEFDKLGFGLTRVYVQPLPKVKIKGLRIKGDI